MLLFGTAPLLTEPTGFWYRVSMPFEMHFLSEGRKAFWRVLSPSVDNSRTITPLSILFETFHSILNSAGTVAETFHHFEARFVGTYQQNAMKVVIIARFFRSNDFLLKCHFHNPGILDCEFAQVASP